MMKERSLVIAMDVETLQQHLEALSVDGSIANHFKTKLGLQLSLASANPLLSKQDDEKESLDQTVVLERLQQHFENLP